MRERRQQQRRSRTQRRHVLFLLTAGLILLAGQVAAAPDRRADWAGDWAEQALGFDPFTLETSVPIYSTYSPPRSASNASSGGGAEIQELGEGEEVRIPYRRPERSPFRPPL